MKPQPKKSAESDWASNEMKKQGDKLLDVVVSYMNSNNISRVSIEAIEKAVMKSNAVLLHNPQCIKPTVKDLIGRELLGKEGQTYFLTRKAKESASQ